MGFGRCSLDKKMIQPGSKFRFLHQKGGGTVYSQLANGKYHVELEEGFFVDVYANEIVEIKIDFSEINSVKNKDSIITNSNVIKNKKSKKNEPILDLHLNQSLQNINHLEMQLSYLKQWLLDCVANKYPFATIIHGDGNGILKKEVVLVLKKNKNIKEILPGDAFKYGTGATKIIFKY